MNNRTRLPASISMAETFLMPLRIANQSSDARASSAARMLYLAQIAISLVAAPLILLAGTYWAARELARGSFRRAAVELSETFAFAALHALAIPLLSLLGIFLPGPWNRTLRRKLRKDLAKEKEIDLRQTPRAKRMTHERAIISLAENSVYLLQQVFGMIRSIV